MTFFRVAPPLIMLASGTLIGLASIYGPAWCIPVNAVSFVVGTLFTIGAWWPE